MTAVFVGGNSCLESQASKRLMRAGSSAKLIIFLSRGIVVMG